MDPFTISLLLGLVGGGMQLIGNASQARANIKEAKEDTATANEELIRQRETARGSLVAQTSAFGVGGQSVNRMLGEAQRGYNEAVDQNTEDLEDYISQTKTDLAFNQVSTLIGTGTNVYQNMYNFGKIGGSKAVGSTIGSTANNPVLGQDIFRFGALYGNN